MENFPNPDLPGPMSIRTLVCKRDLPLAFLCYESLFAALEGKCRLFIHEDGTLDERDADDLRTRFPEAVVLRRAEHEPVVLEKLEKYPHCRNYRKAQPLSNKLLDIPLLSDGPIRFLDSDVLFFRKMRSLFPAGNFSVSLYEDGDSHSAPLLRLICKYKLPIPAGFNSGVLQLERSGYDLDRIEWFLSKPDLLDQAHMGEQTSYAMLMGSRPAFQFSPARMLCSIHRIAITPQTAGVHFMYSLKPRIPEFHAAAMESIDRSEPVEIELQPALPLSVARIVKRRLLRPFRKQSPGT
jgi:hypothetical protein